MSVEAAADCSRPHSTQMLPSDPSLRTHSRSVSADSFTKANILTQMDSVEKMLNQRKQAKDRAAWKRLQHSRNSVCTPRSSENEYHAKYHTTGETADLCRRVKALSARGSVRRNSLSAMPTKEEFLRFSSSIGKLELHRLEVTQSFTSHSLHSPSVSQRSQSSSRLKASSTFEDNDNTEFSQSQHPSCGESYDVRSTRSSPTGHVRHLAATVSNEQFATEKAPSADLQSTADVSVTVSSIKSQRGKSAKKSTGATNSCCIVS